jgi:ribosomal protein L11 methyltransferase
MAYLELSFVLPENDIVADVLVANLSEIGCDSFLQEENILKAYIGKDLFNQTAIENILEDDLLHEVRFTGFEVMKDQNWNAVWESSYQPVVINEKCRIRAPFHEPDSAFEFDLLIEPRMSFGTAHHDTTAQMLGLLLQHDFSGKATLDMGSGTAILAILARKLGAYPVVAIDIDEWAFNNANDNILLNNTEDIQVELGDADTIGDRKFDIILANINRNILVADMSKYAQATLKGGNLMLSGFYVADLPIIKDKAADCGFHYISHTSSNEWVAAVFVKM